MSKKIMAFGDIENEKRKFHHRKNLILLNNVDIEKMQVFIMAASGENNNKYFIGYKDDDHKTKMLRILLPKTTFHIKSYDGEIKWMYFFY